MPEPVCPGAAVVRVGEPLTVGVMIGGKLAGPAVTNTHDALWMAGAGLGITLTLKTRKNNVVAHPIQGTPGEDPVWQQLRRLAGDHVNAPADVLVVIMDRVAVQGSVADQQLRDPGALTLMPDALAALTPPSVAADSPPKFLKPLILLSARHLAKANPVGRAAIVAHELGHALGLSHTDVAGNLMRVGPVTCWPRLTNAQVARMRISLRSLR